MADLIEKKLAQMLAGNPMPDWTQHTTTQAEVKTLILDNLWTSLPLSPFTDEEGEALAASACDHVWHRAAGISREGISRELSNGGLAPIMRVLLRTIAQLVRALP